MERRLSAILAADVVGYRRLMGTDEAGTLTALKDVRTGFIDGKIAEHQGRVVKLTGDGILAEFPSVVSAVACAVELQRGIRERNADVPQDRRIEFRIGVNLGDVIVEGADIYGDGVNVAARLESIAEPGGIAISGSVRDHVGNRLKLSFEDRGEQQLKNIEKPIRVYHVLLDQPMTADTNSGKDERPSIAVLPFNNMSGDAEQEYFSDGISEDIITALSKLRWFFVIARNSSFTYKGKAVRLQQVADELGVRYVLEGSVRKGGDRVRITAQLNDVATGSHIWAERYDRELADVFAVQDEITEAIVAAIEPQLYAAENFRAKRKPPDSMDAWDLVMRALSYYWRVTREDNIAAQALLEKAIAIDPNYARALAVLAVSHTFGTHMGWEDKAIAMPVAERAALEHFSIR